MQVPLRALVVDDEPIARRRLCRLLARLGDVAVAGEAADHDEAVAAAQALRPDVMLLDIQMPGGDGFGVIDRLGAAAPPVIFVTAFDQFALRAFDLAAVDYLTKPVDLPRLDAAIGRVRAAFEARDRDERLAELQATVAALRAALGGQAAAPRDLWVKGRDGHRRLGADQIDYVSAERDYVRVHCAGQSHLVAETLASIEARLAPFGFLRIHRSLLVRRAAVAGLAPRRYGAIALRLLDGTELRVGRSHVAAVMRGLGLPEQG